MAVVGPRARPASRQPPLTASTRLDERRAEGELAGEVDQDSFEIALDGPGGAPPRGLTRVSRVAPERELARDRLLDRLAIGKVGRAARAAADEVGFVERQTLGEARHLDQAADALARAGCHAEPVPAALDDLAERAHRDATALLGERQGVAHHVAGGCGLALAREAHSDGRHVARAPTLARGPRAVQDSVRIAGVA